MPNTHSIAPQDSFYLPLSIQTYGLSEPLRGTIQIENNSSQGTFQAAYFASIIQREEDTIVQPVLAPPKLRISQRFVNMGPLTAGTKAVHSLSIENTGGQLLSIKTVQPRSNWLRILDFAREVASKSAIDIVVEVSAEKPIGERTGRITIRSNGGNETVVFQHLVKRKLLTRRYHLGYEGIIEVRFDIDGEEQFYKSDKQGVVKIKVPEEWMSPSTVTPVKFTLTIGEIQEIQRIFIHHTNLKLSEESKQRLQNQ